MKSISLLRIGVCATAFAAVSAAAFPMPIHSHARQQSVAAMTKSASGKVSNVGNDGFSLDVKSGDSGTTMQFFTDAKTKVKGTLAVGATASVEYRTDGDGRNIAIAIVVQTNS